MHPTLRVEFPLGTKTLANLKKSLKFILEGFFNFLDSACYNGIEVSNLI